MTFAHSFLAILMVLVGPLTFAQGVTQGTAPPVDERPNIVVILADDLGIGDLGCYNSESKIPTPEMDRLAREGMRFTDAHSPSAVCTPTRYGLLTGRYCWRTWLKRSVLDGFDPPLIETDRLTLPRVLQEQGYRTACIGKWHLGMQWTDRQGQPVGRRDLNRGFRSGDDVDFDQPISGGPTAVGFEEFFGISASLDMPPYCFLENDRPVELPTSRSPEQMSLYLNQAEGVRSSDFKLHEVLPTLTRKAVKYIKDQEASSNPFFLYFPLTAPHYPIVPGTEYAGSSKAGHYGDFVCEVDATVGAIQRALQRTGQDHNTMVVVTSDNGSLWHWWRFQEADDIAHGELHSRGATMKEFGHRSNGLLRGLKGDIWEGGHRVPFLVRWPAKVKAGSVCSELIELTDVMATCSSLVGTELPSNAAEDSYSFASLLLNSNSRPARPFAVHHSFLGMFSIRSGPWKLVEGRGSGGFSRPRNFNVTRNEAAGQLYDLASDPYETVNRWKDEPETVQRLTKQLEEVQSENHTLRPRMTP